MKKMTAMMMALVMAGSLMACGNTSNGSKASETNTEIVVTSETTSTGETGTSDSSTVTTESEVAVGAYERPDSPVITDEIRKVCEKGFEGLVGASYEPVALIGTQVVSGTNYCILFRTTPAVQDAKETYALGYLYEDLDDNVEVTDIVDSSVETNISDDETVTGGWTQPDSPEITDEARAAFEKAVDDLDDTSYTPLALLATQVVSGTNYAFFCEKNGTGTDSEKTYQVVYIYQDLEGDSEISDIVKF